MSDNNTRQTYAGTGEFLWSRGARTAAEAQLTGFQSFGNIKQIEAQTSSETKDHYQSYRGKKVLNSTHVTQFEIRYNITVDEMDARNVGILVYGDPDYDFGSDGADNAHAGLTNATGTPLVFGSTNPVVVYNYYDLLDANGNRLIDLTAVSLVGKLSQYGDAQDKTALIEGVDFDVDKKNAMVKFLRSFSADTITPSLSTSAVTSASTNYMTKLKPLQQGYLSGMGRIFIYDQDLENNLALSHRDFFAHLSIDGNVSLASDDFAEMTLKLSVLVPEGELLVR